MTVDLSNLDGSTLNLVTGEAGNLLSPYYMINGRRGTRERHSPAFSKRAVDDAQAHLLVLEPR